MREQVHGEAVSGAVCMSRSLSTGIDRLEVFVIYRADRTQLFTNIPIHFDNPYAQNVIRKHIGDRRYILLAS